MYCSKCGNHVNGSYCSNCGTKAKDTSKETDFREFPMESQQEYFGRK